MVPVHKNQETIMATATRSPVHFACGQLVMTPGVAYLVQEGSLRPVQYLARHFIGDWGDLSDRDRAANDAAVRRGERLLSSYRITDTLRLWIITEADRSATTLLLPHEY
jgi:hypothetical protein